MRGRGSPRAVLLALALLLAPLDGAECHGFCDESCTELNGDVAYECGACDEGWRCRPGAPGFPVGATEAPLADVGAATAQPTLRVVAMPGQQSFVISNDGMVMDERAPYLEHAETSEATSSTLHPCQRITAD